MNGERPGGERLGWLDVLRAVAASTVALYHLGNMWPAATPEFNWISHSLLQFGSFGVMLFFIVSGYIIPASLERRGSLPEFWINRFFRLVPLFWVLTGAVVVLWSLNRLALPDWIFNHPAVVFVGNASLLTNFVGAPHLVATAWTLPYEICFYAFTSVIFVTRFRRSSWAFALFLAGFALLAAETLLPTSALTPQAHSDPAHVGNPVLVLVLAAAVAVGAALATRSRTLAIYAAAVGFVATALFLNRSWPLHQAMIFLALMFTGTVIYRISAGQMPARRGWPVVVAVPVLAAGAFLLHFEPWYNGAELGGAWWTEAIASAVAVLVFVGAYATRDRVHWPEPLQWLGRISYSVYFVHWIVMESVPGLPASVPGYTWLSLVMWIAVTLVVSQLTYMFVEQPGVRLGRRVAGWYRDRYGRPALPDPDLARDAAVAASAMTDHIPAQRLAVEPAQDPTHR
jgi:peptidoglycan/LPS O-acetylase OafA/YrhL